MIQFCRAGDEPDDISQMYQIKDGKYVLYVDAKETIEFAIEVLCSLRDCSQNNNSAEYLNLVCDRAVEELKVKL